MSAFFLDYGDGRSGSAAGVAGVINSYAAATGTAGSRTVTTALSVAIGDLVFLWQTQGTGANNCEMVRAATATSGGAFTTTIALTNSYTTGAQGIKVPQYSAGAFGALSATAWNGTIGGICIAVANGPVTVPLSSNLDGKGFRGGAGALSIPNNPATGIQGEGTPGVGIAFSLANANGGGGGEGGNIGAGHLGGGAGGGNTTFGTQGGTGSSGGTAGTAGNASGSTTTMSLGAGGGGGGSYDSGTGGSGGNGAADLILFAPSIQFTGLFTANGAVGGSVGATNAAAGGGGSGGNIYVGGSAINFGATLAKAKGNTGGSANPNAGAGGAGSDGRIVALAPLASAVTGTSDPTYTFVADNSFAIVSQGYVI